MRRRVTLSVCEVCSQPLVEHNRHDRYNHSEKGRARWRRYYMFKGYLNRRDRELAQARVETEAKLLTVKKEREQLERFIVKATARGD
jgi:hypothetical protein